MLPSLALRMILLPSTDGYTSMSLARTLYIRSCASSISENTHARNRTRDASHIAETSGSHKVKGTNCLFASKDHVRPVSKRLCIIFMACSCPNFVLGRLKKKKRKKKEDGENRGFSVFRI